MMGTTITLQRMSSIISDLFYGSKQNILDNYLVHRHDRQNTSTLNKQELPPQDSFIQFVITPAINSIDFTALLKIQVELGNHVEEEMLQLSPEAESPAAVLTLQQIEKAELGKLTNVKITVSEGRQWRAFGFIPIETIRSTISSPSGEKTVLVQLKGKDALLNTLQCTIRTEFPSNTILNSQLMRSMQREHNSYIRSKHQISDQSSQLRPNMPRSPKQIVARRKSPSNNRSGQFSKPSPKQKHSSYAAEQTSKMERRKKSDLVGDGGVTEYVKEIKSIQLIFSKVNLIQSLNAPETQINLRAAGLDYSIGQIIEVKSFTKQGVNVQLVMRGKVVGRIHLSPLLLTLNKISGELPIYSESEQCMGTVIVKSPHHIEPPRNQAIIHQQHHPLPKEQVLNDLVVISIEKVLLVKPSDKYEDDHFEFSKMEGSKVEVVVRLNDTIHRFGEVALHRNLQGQYLEMAELRRKDGFFLRYLQETRDELVLEIEVFSAYRLIAYGKTKIHASSHFFHSFIPGQSQCPILHSGFYAKVMRLQPKSVYFQEHRTDVIFEVLQDIVQNKIVLTQITDAQIKRMMNLHHNATYVELKKLSILIQPHQDELQSFQSGSLMSIQKSKASTERLWGKLLDEFSCVKTKEGLVDEAEFTKIVEFYGEQIHGSLEEKFQQFVSNPVRTQDYINYLFFVTGHFFTIKQLSKSIQLARQIIPASIAKPKQVQPVEKEHVQELKGEGGLKADPCYYISKIIIHNAHLLNQGRAPNICLSVGRKVCYSNSNPEFNLQREVSLLTPIKVYHKSIAEDRLVEVAQFHPLRRQSHYQLDLTGKCFAKVTWGL